MFFDSSWVFPWLSSYVMIHWSDLGISLVFNLNLRRLSSFLLFFFSSFLLFFFSSFLPFFFFVRERERERLKLWHWFLWTSFQKLVDDWNHFFFSYGISSPGDQHWIFGKSFKTGVLDLPVRARQMEWNMLTCINFCLLFHFIHEGVGALDVKLVLPVSIFMFTPHPASRLPF